MKTILGTLLITLTLNANADGFLCTTESGLNVKVYNHTDVKEGTRNASVIVISNPELDRGNRTVAQFSDLKSTLSSRSQTYAAKVDLRVSESSRGGEYLAGTRLMYIDMIFLTVDFNYNLPVSTNSELNGMMTILKRNGEQIIEEANCTRYLKN